MTNISRYTSGGLDRSMGTGVIVICETGFPPGQVILVPAGMVTTRLLAQRIPDGEAATWH